MRSKTRNLLIYYFFLAFFFVLLAEFSSHIVLKQSDQGANVTVSSRHVFHPFRAFSLNTQYNRDFDSGGQKIHSDDGFRSDTVINKDKPDDVYRIIMLGGSTLYGIGATGIYPSTPTLDNNQTVPHYLEKQIADYIIEQNIDKKVEVINAGVTAYTTFHHLVYFNEVLFEYSPDLLIFLDGHNDFYAYEQYNNWHRYTQGTPKLTHHFNERTFWFTGLSVARYFAQASNFFMLVEKYMMRVWKDPGITQYAQSAFPREHTAKFPDNVETILKESVFKSYVQFNALGKIFDFETIVFLQPQVVFEDESLLSETDKQIQAITLEHDFNKRRDEVRPHFAELFEKYEIKFVDIGEIATADYADDQLYTDYCHLTPKGSEVVASRMLPHITKILATRINS